MTDRQARFMSLVTCKVLVCIGTPWLLISVKYFRHSCVYIPKGICDLCNYYITYVHKIMFSSTYNPIHMLKSISL